jgi:hypothetical protein
MRLGGRLLGKRLGLLGSSKAEVCGGAGEEREEAGSFPFGFAQGQNDNQKSKS